ncbi:MAG: ComF family protein [Acidobacteriaceae bacterium]|nr:ComF family protein [Acidobacteriaceae bacterium]
MAASLGMSECTMCRLAPPEFTRAVAYAEYGDTLRDQLFLLKYQHQRNTATHLLGARLAQAILRLRPEAAESLLVVPVPLYFERERERGFNQATLLAQGAIARLRRLAPGWSLTLADNVMVRTRPTPPLYSLSPKQRRSRLAGAFQVLAPEVIAGREVLLLDDIMTTGSTARECARALRRAGASKVWVATVARTQPFGSAWMDEAAINGPPLPSGVALWDGGSSTQMH